MNRIHSALVTGFLIATFFTGPKAAAQTTGAQKPNILLILSDDQGYADAGFQGSKDIPTPNLDRLAHEGLRFSNGYVTHPFCSPSRAGLLTGRYQQRFGHEQNPRYDPNDHREGLPIQEKLLPEFLRTAGYITGWIGKWHLGSAPEFHPQARGFMETFGFIGGGHRYLGWKPKMTGDGREYSAPILRNGQPAPVTNHLTTAFGDEGADFVRRHKNQPWFLYLAFNAPHVPLEPTRERLARFKSIPDLKRRKYAAQISLMDDAIGNVLTALRESGQDKRTLVFFFSDNGGPINSNHWNGSSNLPLRGGKGDIYEGGMRVPFVMCWPDHLPSGRTCDSPVSSLDVFPTALALAGVPMPTNKIYDGVNLIPFLTGANTNSPHDKLFWRTGGGHLLAERDGDLKLVRIGKRPEQLYDLGNDLAESHDLSTNRSNQLQKLNTALEKWNSQLVPPAFSASPAKPNRKGSIIPPKPASPR